MSVQTEQLPVERFEFNTADPAAAESVINDTYVGYRPRVSGSTKDFTFDVSRTSAGSLSLDHIAHSMAMTVESEPFEQLMFFFPTAGTLGVAAGGVEARLGAGNPVLYPVGVPLRISWSPIRTEILSIPLEAAEQAAAEHDDVHTLRFVGMRPVSSTMDRFWRSTVGFVAAQLEAPGSPMAEPLVQSRTLGLLGAAALRTFPNTTMSADYRPGPGQAGPAALRRAVAFIDANADLPITLTDISGAAAVSPRALQYAFARHYDTSPLDYLRRVRLERAHRDLQAADPSTGATVAGIAAHWGFAKPGNFSAAYHGAYGRAPRHTLRN